MPARTEPVIATICGVWCWTSVRPVSRSPQTTLSTPGGRNSCASSAIIVEVAGRGVGGLEDDGVARGQRGGDLPDHHRQRVVPRRHLADHADRLAADEGGVVLHVLPGRLALEHAGGAGEEAEVVDGRRHLLAGGQAERLAGVAALGRHELLRAGLQRVRDPQQGQRALLRRRTAPGAEGALGRGVGAVHVLGAGQRGAGVHLPGAGIHHLVGLAGHGVDGLTVDDVAEGLVLSLLGHGASVVIPAANREVRATDFVAKWTHDARIACTRALGRAPWP